MRQGLRLVLKAIQKYDPAIKVEFLRQNRHTMLCLTRGETKKKLAVSVSPKNEHFLVQNVLEDVRKHFKEIPK
jgi:hypothetical protein